MITVILNINKKQYRKLVELLAIAQTEVETFFEHDLLEESELEECQQVLHSIFKHSAKMDCEYAIEYDSKQKEWHVTEPLFQYLFDQKYAVEMALFKEHLAFFMAKKQVHLDHPSLNELPDKDTMYKSIYKLADQYQPIMDEHGLALLEWTTEEKLQKQYPSLDTEEFYLAQALSLNPQAQLIDEIFHSEEFDIEVFLKDSGIPSEQGSTQNNQTKKNNVIDFPTNNQTPAELKIQLKRLKTTYLATYRNTKQPQSLSTTPHYSRPIWPTRLSPTRIQPRSRYY